MTSGLIALTRWQAAIEATRGTAIAATRVVPMVGTPLDKLETFEGEQDRGTFEKFYPESIVRTKRHVEATGCTAIGTFDDAPWWAQFAIKGSVAAAGPTNTTCYTYTFVPTLTSDDLSTMCLEWGTDTAAYVINYGMLKKFEWTYNRNSPVMFGIDILGQKMTAQAFTGSLAQRVCEGMQTGLTTAYIDTTTIGSTAPGDVLEAKATIDNGWEQIFELGGNEWAGKAVRPRRTLALEATIQFDTTTEYDTAIAKTARKIRLKTTGTTIASSSPATPKSHTLDIYIPKWKVADFGRLGGIWTIKVSGSSAYDSAAAASFSLVVVNDLATLP